MTTTQKTSATNLRNLRTFLRMRQEEARQIGGRIALARKEADGMTQGELADLLNVSARSIQDYEAGVTIPWKYFRDLEKIFPSHTFDWFLHGTEPSNGAQGGAGFVSLLDEIAAQLDEGNAPKDRVLTVAQALRTLADETHALANDLVSRA